MQDETLFAREDVLLPEYLPEILPHRESQIQVIADNIKPAAFGRKPENSFIFGAPGIGKTATAKFIFRQFEEFSERVKTIYINCWDYRTSHAVLSKIAIFMDILILL